MSTKKIIIIIVLAGLIVGLGYYLWIIGLKGGYSISENINEAKRREVLIFEYVPLVNPFMIKDSILFDVKTVWLEKVWYKKSIPWKTNIANHLGYTLIVESDTINSYITTIDKPFIIGEKNKKLHNGYLSLDSIPLKDTLKFPVFYNVGKNKGKHMGNFVLIKKGDSGN